MVIPKGEYVPGAEDALEAAKREFQEETGYPPPEGQYLSLGEIKQPGGKIVNAWAVEGDCDASSIRSNTYSVEWPPHSGRRRRYPEVDRAGWFHLEEATLKILRGQLPLLAELGKIAARERVYSEKGAAGDEQSD